MYPRSVEVHGSVDTFRSCSAAYVMTIDYMSPTMARWLAVSSPTFVRTGRVRTTAKMRRCSPVPVSAARVQGTSTGKQRSRFSYLSHEHVELVVVVTDVVVR